MWRDSILSDRLRPNIEAAPWVIDEVRKLEQELADAYLEMRKIRPVVKAIFDRAVWDRSEKPNVEFSDAGTASDGTQG